MMDSEFILEQSPLDAVLEQLQPGQSLCALEFLTLTEGESEQAVEDGLAQMEQQRITLDISRLPLRAGEGKAAVRLLQEQQLAKQADLRQGLEETDPLRMYLEELAAMPAAGDPEQLALRYANGEEALLQPLTDLCLSRVVELAKEYTGYGVLLLDLIQEGSLGLWQGLLQFDGGDFGSQRDWWIRQYLARAVTLQARSGGLGQKLRTGLEDYRDVDTRLLGELGRNPTLEEIAEQLHLSPEAAQIYESMLTAARTLQQAVPPEPEEETPEEADQAVENTAYFQLRQRIADLLSGLSEQDAELITLRFGLEGGLPLSPQETGNRLGLTPQAVSEREAKILAQLRLQG